MKARTFAGLFIGNVAILVYGLGYIPLMPLYAGMRGASDAIAGSYIATAFLLLSAGAILGGRLADRVRSRRVLLLATSALAVPMVWLVGRTAGVWPLIAVTALSWLPCGVSMAVISTIAGREAAPGSRGRVFGALGLTGGVGGAIGSAFAGSAADAYGYPALLAIMAAVLVLTPLSALFLVREKADPATTPVPQAATNSVKLAGLGVPILLLLASQILLQYTAGTGGLGSTLAMKAASFTAAQISRTNAVASLIGLPLPLVLGWLSDRLSRKGIVIGGCLVRAGCMLFLMLSKTPWQFAAALTLVGLAASANGVSSALATDLAHPSGVGGAMGFLQGAQYLGQVAGFAVAGVLFQASLRTGFVVGVALSVAAAALTLSVRWRRPAADGTVAAPG